MKSKIDKSIVADNFSRHALSYDEYTDVQKEAAALLGMMLPKDGVLSILEIGCGTGGYTEILRNRFKSATIKAVDISGPMVKAAKEKVNDERVSFEVGDIEVDGLLGEYDLVTSSAVFHWLGTLEDTIKKLGGRIISGGRLIFSAFGPQTFLELKWALGKAIGEDISITPDAFADKPELESILRRYFKDVRVTERLIRETYPSIHELLKKIKYSGTRGSGIGVRKVWSPALLKKIEREYAAKFGSIEATYQIFFCEATK